jgi:hypothetical protein
LTSVTHHLWEHLHLLISLSQSLYFSVVDFGSSVDTPLYDSPSDWEREIILYFSVVDFGSSVDTPPQELPVAAMFVNGSKRNEHSL